MLRHFKAGSFVSSKDISKKTNLNNALASLYVIPTFFRGVYYLPTERERHGHFIENPQQFFRKLFALVYGNNNWYWSLSTASRIYGMEWSSTKILELVTPKESKTIDIFKRTSSLENKKSYRSKILAKFYVSLGINTVIVHKGKKTSMKQIKIDEDIGPVATKARIKEDAIVFMPKTRTKALKRLYRKYLRAISP